MSSRNKQQLSHLDAIRILLLGHFYEECARGRPLTRDHMKSILAYYKANGCLLSCTPDDLVELCALQPSQIPLDQQDQYIPKCFDPTQVPCLRKHLVSYLQQQFDESYQPTLRRPALQIEVEEEEKIDPRMFTSSRHLTSVRKRKPFSFDDTQEQDTKDNEVVLKILSTPKAGLTSPKAYRKPQTPTVVSRSSQPICDICRQYEQHLPTGFTDIPVTTPCGHSFHVDCLKQRLVELRQMIGGNLCPTCYDTLPIPFVEALETGASSLLLQPTMASRLSYSSSTLQNMQQRLARWIEASDNNAYLAAGAFLMLVILVSVLLNQSVGSLTGVAGTLGGQQFVRKYLQTYAWTRQQISMQTRQIDSYMMVALPMFANEWQQLFANTRITQTARTILQEKLSVKMFDLLMQAHESLHQLALQLQDEAVKQSSERIQNYATRVINARQASLKHYLQVVSFIMAGMSVQDVLQKTSFKALKQH